MLLYYSRRGSLPLGKMGERLQIHPTSVTNTIDGLQKLGYVARTQDEQDRRKRLASILPEGREAAERVTEVLNRERFGTAPLRKQDLDTVYEVLQALRRSADE
jgi:DNA-binding MarR family transcriptional regulator